MEQLEWLDMAPGKARKDEVRERKEADVLKLQRSIVVRMENIGDGIGGQVFVDALARFRVRLKLYEQMSCIKEELE